MTAETWTDWTPAGRNALAVKYRALAYRVANRLVRKTPDADIDDLAGVAWFAVVKASRRFDESCGIKFISFAYVAARNEVVDELRIHRRYGFRYPPKVNWNAPATSWGHDHDGPPLTIEHVADKSDRCGEVSGSRVRWSESEWADVLRHVPDASDREVVYLWAHGWTDIEIAAKHGVTRSWVGQQRKRAMRALRVGMPGLEGEIMETTRAK